MRIALGIPHAPWIEGRPESLARLIDVLKMHSTRDWSPVDYKVFSDRESNRSWARKLWTWGAFTDCDWLLQLQDDVIVPPFFWRALHAMLENFQGACMGLEAAHPSGPLLAQQGMRWYRTRAWVVGVGWVLRRDVVKELLAWDGPPELNEDDYIGAFLNRTGRDAYHPVPSIIDHDLSVPSAYMNEGHALRRPTVLWHKYPEAVLCDPEFWRDTDDAPLLISPYSDVCWFCLSPKHVNRTHVQSKHTGAIMCGWCVANVVNAHMGRKII